MKYYQKAHEIDPESPYYIVSMANYYEVVGNKDAAETQIRNALVNEKLDVETKVGILSRYILKLQQTKKGTESANALFQTLLEQHPEDTDLKQMYGSLLVAQGKTDEARFQFQLITEMEPSNAAAWQQLLNLALKSEDIPEVIRICTPMHRSITFILGSLISSRKSIRMHWIHTKPAWRLSRRRTSG